MTQPDPKKFPAAKKSLRRFLRKVIRDSAQLVRDLESWNDNRPDAPPFDVGGQLVLIKLAKQMLSLVEAERHIPKELYAELLGQAERLAECE